MKNNKNIVLSLLVVAFVSPYVFAKNLGLNTLDQTLKQNNQPSAECTEWARSNFQEVQKRLTSVTKPAPDSPIIVEDDDQIHPPNRESDSEIADLEDHALQIANQCGAKAHKTQWFGGGWWGSVCSAGCFSYGWVGQSCACTYTQTVCNWWGGCQLIPIVQWGFIMY